MNRFINIEMRSPRYCREPQPLWAYVRADDGRDIDDGGGHRRIPVEAFADIVSIFLGIGVQDG